MKIVLQRVSKATVNINEEIGGSIGTGILLLVGVHVNDTEVEADFLADKCIELRIFPDEDGKMNRSLIDIGGSALVVSQFTLLGDCSKGRRPSFIAAAPQEKGNELYRHFVNRLKMRVKDVQTGIFGAMMQVELINNGPVTMILERVHSLG
ncbi:MAG: D-tyrosyl-tRNA(Tyr) deacylase [Chitinispirillaceae bacterium]|nr:D-tyrosyl-tRNA(Tyr) deacylase [Chitinispirillaceae bacterium]